MRAGREPSLGDWILEMRETNKSTCFLKERARVLSCSYRDACMFKHTRTHTDSPPCIQNSIKLVSRAARCNLVGVQNGF